MSPSGDMCSVVMSKWDALRRGRGALWALQHCSLGSIVCMPALWPRQLCGQCSAVARAAVWAVQHCGPGSADSQESLLVFSWPGQHCVHANTVAWAASWAVQLCCLPKVCQSV